MLQCITLNLYNLANPSVVYISGTRIVRDANLCFDRCCQVVPCKTCTTSDPSNVSVPLSPNFPQKDFLAS